MPLAVKREPFTYRDLANFSDDGKLREVIGGELCVTAAPNTRHQRLVGELFSPSDRSYKVTFSALSSRHPFEVVFSEEDTVQPDVVFIRQENAGIITENASWVRPTG
jgi:hypothetical protein